MTLLEAVTQGQTHHAESLLRTAYASHHRQWQYPGVKKDLIRAALRSRSVAIVRLLWRRLNQQVPLPVPIWDVLTLPEHPETVAFIAEIVEQRYIQLTEWDQTTDEDIAAPLNRAAVASIIATDRAREAEVRLLTIGVVYHHPELLAAIGVKAKNWTARHTWIYRNHPSCAILRDRFHERAYRYMAEDGLVWWLIDRDVRAAGPDMAYYWAQYPNYRETVMPTLREAVGPALSRYIAAAL